MACAASDMLPKSACVPSTRMLASPSTAPVETPPKFSVQINSPPEMYMAMVMSPWKLVKAKSVPADSSTRMASSPLST